MRTGQRTLAALVQVHLPLRISSASWRFPTVAAVPSGQVPSALIALTGRLSPLPGDQRARRHFAYELGRIGGHHRRHLDVAAELRRHGDRVQPAQGLVDRGKVAHEQAPAFRP